MKIKLFFLGILLFSSMSLRSQETPKIQNELIEGLPLYNLFYLSKYLNAQNLDDLQKNAVNAQFFNLIGSENITILSNDKNQKFDHLKEYLNNLIKTSPKNVQFITYLKTEKWNEFQELFFKTKSDEKYRKFLVEIQNITQKRNADKNTQEDCDIRIAKFKNEIEDRNKKIDILKSNKNAISEIHAEQAAVKEDSIEVANLITSYQKLTPEIKENDDLLMKKITAYGESYFSDNSQLLKTPYTKKDVLKFYIEKEKLQTVNISTNYVQSVQSQGTSSLKIPSQAQLIDAMAIFLANRAKQETAIWFMDQLRTRLKNPLVQDAFPETIGLLQKLEDYKVPNFGVEWRYAISSDFIEMPLNISKSSWIDGMISDPKQTTDLKNLIELAYNVNRLMAENYNYRDLIQTLYLDELQNKPNSEQNQFLSKSIALLYVLTNELYSIDNTSNNATFRLLTFEELNSLDQTQWNYLIEMIRLKYFSDKDKQQFDGIANLLEGVKNKKEAANIFASKILLNLSQFDKIRNELQESKSKEKDDFSKQNLFSAWKIIEQVLDNMGDINLVFPTPLQTSSNSTIIVDKEANAKNIKNLKTSFSIYENIQNRNFSSAIQETLNLVKEFYVYKNLDFNEINKEIKSIVINNQKLNFAFTEKGDSLKLYKISSVEDSSNTYLNGKYFRLNFDDLSQKKLKLYNLDFPKKNFLEDITKDTNQYEKLLKKLNITSDDFVNYICLALAKPYVIKSDKTSVNKDIYYYQNNLNEKYGAQLLKLTSFFGDVLTTTNSQQLSDVISSHALPPTSYKLKRKVRSSIDLNAFVGGYGGYRIPISSSTFNHDLTGGITAPIGITFSKSFGQNKSCNLGFSVNFIDLGNIVNHYLTSTEQYYKDVHFSEVFSPNLNLFYSIPRTPAVFFIGATFLPLKSIMVGTEIKNTTAFDVMIIQAGLAIDIPLINLWTNEKN